MNNRVLTATQSSDPFVARRAADRSQPARRALRRARRGNVLVLFAMLTFVIMGLAALVIDVGYARLAQRQMQTAVDSAALEGLRFRDALPAVWITDPPAWLTANPPTGAGAQPPTAYDPANPAWQQWLALAVPLAQRFLASEMVAVTFDDDLNPSNGDPLNFGAGPVVNFSGGVGDPSLQASQLMTVPSPPVYKPVRADGTPGLELNPNDRQNGDMAAGNYQNGIGVETADYARTDFIYDPAPGETPRSALGSYLVRMRRTQNAQNQGLNPDNQPGVSSSGPTVPFLFGRGSLLPRSSANAGDLTVESGVTVRATAIADSRPALSVGAAQPTPSGGAEPGIPGAAPFVLFDAQVTGGQLSGAASTVTVAANGTLTLATNNAVIGYVTNAAGASSPTWAGLPATPATPTTAADFVQGMWTSSIATIGDAQLAYVPIVHAPTAAAPATIDDHVIGFVVGSFSVGSATTFLLTVQPTAIANTNAIATFLGAVPAGVDGGALLAANASLAPYTILVPVLANH